MRRVLIPILLVLFAVAPLGAAVPAMPAENPWLGRGVLHIAHQGGEIEAPSNTMFAFATAVEKGADVVELDVHATKDGHLVVLHDTTVDRTTNGSGRVDAMTLAEIRALDAAYWFVPGCGTCHGHPESAYVYRGIATEDRPAPQGFDENDFRIPTLEAVLKEFRDVPLNIEIKRTAPETTPYERTLAELLQQWNRSDDVIVVSFLDHAVELFKVWAPHVHTAVATGEAAAFWASAQGPLPGAPNPRYVALQVPITYEGLPVVTQEFVDRAQANGLAVHVWTINDRPTMEWLIDLGVDGIMTDRPTLLHEILVERDLR